MAKVNLFSEDWCDMVFEDKNQNYGAYFLRKLTPKNHFFALLVSVLFFSIAVSAPVIFKAIMPKEKEKNVEVTNLANLKVDKPVEQPKLDQPPPEKAQVKFSPPVIRPDEEVKDDEFITQDELSKTTLPIGNDNDTVDLSALNDKPKVVEEVMKPYTFVEQMPDFPGGEEELMKFLKSNIVYPQMAKESGIQGTVYVTFVVTSNGKVKDGQVLRGIGGGCDEEALRVVKIMPDWKAGKQNGQAVPVQFNLPIKFILQ
jgi:protein TonB